MRSYLVTGTDTGVGKTVVTCALARGVAAAGKSVFLHKPIETGGTSDIENLRSVASNKENLYTYTFSKPLAPNVASRLDNKLISWDLLLENIERLAVGDVQIIEGAGGLLVPITDNKTYLDLILEAKLCPIVVAANKLGVISHFDLTLSVLRANDVEIGGYFMSEVDNNGLESNRDELLRVARKHKVLELGVVPFTEDLSQLSLCLPE